MKIELTGDDKQKVKLINYLNRNKIDFSNLEELESHLVTTEQKKIDFNARKTELKWIHWLDKTALNYVPKWFNFLRWIVLLGFLNYLSETSNDWKVKLIYLISMFGLFVYLQGYFYSYKFEGVPLIKSEAYKRHISFFLSLAVLTATWLFIRSVIPIIKN